MTTLVDSDDDFVAIHGQPASLHIPILHPLAFCKSLILYYITKAKIINLNLQNSREVLIGLYHTEVLTGLYHITRTVISIKSVHNHNVVEVDQHIAYRYTNNVVRVFPRVINQLYEFV